MCLSRPKAPAPKPELPEAPRPPEQTSAVRQSDRDRRRRAGMSAGRSGTILTGAQGVTTPGTTGQKTLLGS